MDADSHRSKMAARSRQKSHHARDIAPGYPEPGNLARRESCRLDLGLFLKTYFPAVFNIPWSIDHPRILASMQDRIIKGGLQALAEPRGYGKTAKSLRALLWGLLYGHRRFGCLIGPTEAHAKKLLKQIKMELLYNPLLAEDFRQVCYPIGCLENNARRAAGQLFEGEPTQIEWTSNSISFPVMPDAACDGPNVGGFIITVAGLTSSLRGQSHVLPTGEIIRPEFAILDDPQTRDSATSVAMTEERLAIVTGDVLGMAGPGREITVIMPCTVIEQGDLADQILDRKKHPEWHGERTKAVYTWPTNEKLWDDYLEVRSEELRNGGDGERATEFYVANREAMDAGAVVAWPERFNPGEVSAIQHAYNTLQKLGRRSYFAEYENDPIADEAEAEQLQADAVASRFNGLVRGVVPLACSKLTAFVDVQQRILYWLVAGWRDGLGGAVIDYGTYPDQKRKYFVAAQAQHTLARAAPGAGLEGSIYAGLTKLADQLLGREWRREDGVSVRIERLLVDAGYQGDTIKTWCRQSPHAAIVMPSHGKGIGAKQKPIAEYSKRPGTGDKVGFHWLLTAGAGKHAIRHLLIDVNFYKSLLAQRLQRAPGDRGALMVFGKKDEEHRLLATHLTAESFVRVQANGREVEEWQLRPERNDNHWFDCLAGAMAAASFQGIEVAEAHAGAGKRKRVSFKEMQQKQAQRNRAG